MLFGVSAALWGSLVFRRKESFMSIGRIDQESRFVNVAGTAFKQRLSSSKDLKGQNNVSL